jgi:FkbM family methyltransferase
MKRVVRELGMEAMVRRIYWKTLLSLSDETWTISIGDSSAAFSVSTKGEFHRFTQGLERETLRRFVDESRPDDVFYDIGANVGLYACVVGDQLSDGHVCAFEPSPVNINALVENIDRNDISATVHDYALSNENTVRKLEFSDEIGTSGTFNARDELGHVAQVEVRAVDDLITGGEIPLPNVVKIDVEAAEYDVLQGMTETLSRESVRTVYVEIHHGYLRSQNVALGDIMTLLEDSGFEIERDGNIWATKNR